MKLRVVFLFLLLIGVGTITHAQNTTENAMLATPNQSTPNQDTVLPTPNILPIPIIEIPVKKEPIYTYLSPIRDGFDFPQQELKKYPNLDISGFHETKYSGRDFTPKSPTDSRLETIRKDPFYDKLPREVLVGSPRLDIRYKINIDGKLSKDLSVHYDIEQEPDFPGKYDVRIDYQKTKLTFGHFDATLVDGELINIRKALDGFMITSYDDSWEGTLAQGKLRSQPNRFSNFGNGTRKISLGTRSILGDSVKVWVNNSPQNQGSDYEIDLYKGEITFSTIKSSTDFIVVIYEFTNPIEDFIPVLNRKNFFGGQFLWRENFKTVHEKQLLLKKSGEILKAAGATPNREYQFNNFPVLLSTEEVKLNGRYLRRNKDYFFKPTKGKLTLANGVYLGAEDQLIVSYDHYETIKGNDTLIAQGSPGPYKLTYSNIIEQTVAVWIDDQPVIELQDYEMDHTTGQLTFTYPIRNGKVISVTYSAIKTEVLPQTKTNAPFSLGVTYATEYVPSQKDQLTSAAATESYTLTTSNIFLTKFNPISVDKPITILVNGVVLPSSNFTVKNAYKGQIEITPPTGVELPYNVKIDYTFSKSFKTNYTFQIKALDSDRTYRNPDHFELRDLPVKFKGISYIRMTRKGEQFVLSPDKEFSVDYGEEGQIIAIHFILQSDPNSLSFLSEAPGTEDVLFLVYDHAVNDTQDQGTLSQQMLGVTATNRWNDKWTSHAEVVVSDHNFSKPSVELSKTLVGNGQVNFNYDLERANVIENSEAVFLNNQRVNRDSDYVINYTTGKVRFVNSTPGTQDTILVNFKALDTGTTQAGSRQTKMATKLATKYVSNDISVVGDFKYIDKNFLPIGDFQEAKGTTVYGAKVAWAPEVISKYDVDYHHRDTFKSLAKDSIRELYLRSDELILNADNKQFYDLLDMTHSFRVLSQVQDQDLGVSTKNTRAIDELTWDYTGKVTFGPKEFKTDVIQSLSQRVSDYIDNYTKGTTAIEKTRIQSRGVWDKVYGLGNTTWTPYVEVSRTQIDQQVPTGSGSTTQTSYTKRTDYGASATALPWTFLPLKVDYNYSEIISKIATSPTESFSFLTNAVYDAGFNPTSWFSSGVTIRHAEAESPLVGQKGSLEDTRTYRVNRLNLKPSVSFFSLNGIPEWVLHPVRDTALNGSRTETTRQENNNTRRYDYVGNQFGISNVEVLPGIKMNNFTYSDALSTNLNTEGNSIASQNEGLSNNNARQGKFSVIPPLPILNLWSYTFDYQDRYVQSISTDFSRTGTSNRLTDNTPEFKRNQVLIFDPGNPHLPFFPNIKLGPFKATLSEALVVHTNSKLTEKFNGFSDATLLSSTVFQDNFETKTISLESSYSPLSLFNTKGNYKKSNDYYSRNILASTTGSLFKEAITYEIKGDVSPFTWLTLEATAGRKNEEQYQASTLDPTLTELESAKEDLDFTTFKDFLKRTEDNFKGGLTWKPFSFINFITSVGYSDLRQEFLNASGNSTQKFTQQTGSLGTTLLPFQGFTSSYIYTLKLTKDQLGTESNGYAGVANISYTPLETTGFKVKITYSREDSWGRDLNTLDRQSTEQGTGATIQSSIVERMDTIETAVLSVDINIPFSKNTGLLDRIVISGEGYLKKVTDQLDPQKSIKRSYDLSGMVIKGTLEF